MAERIEIRVPDIGDFEDVPVIEVLVAVGDAVTAEQSIVTLESDKATMEVPSPADGVVASLEVALDDTVSEGDLVAVLTVEGAGDAVGEKAPDFELPFATKDGKVAEGAKARLSSFRNEKPVALIFGSYT